MNNAPADFEPFFHFRPRRRRLGVPAWIWLLAGFALLASIPSARRSNPHQFSFRTLLCGDAVLAHELIDGTHVVQAAQLPPPVIDAATIRAKTYVYVTIRNAGGGSHPSWGFLGLCRPEQYFQAEVAAFANAGPVTPGRFDKACAPIAAQWMDQAHPDLNAGPFLRASQSTWSAPWPEGRKHNLYFLTYRGLELIGLFLLAIGVYALLVAKRAEKRAMYLHAKVCPKCGYQLDGLRGDTCPERGERLG